jgi:hypothetical protein
MVSGWGYTKMRVYGEGYDREFFPRILKQTKIEIFSRSACKAVYRNRSRNIRAALENGGFW